MKHDIKSRYKVIEHSGDLALMSWGSDYLEALGNASLCLTDQVVGLLHVEPMEQLSFSIFGDDERTRTIGLLNEIIYLIFVKRWLPCGVKRLTHCQSKGCSELQVILAGESADLARHTYKYDIKAVTYHGFEVLEEAGRVTIRFVCDL
jgi:SHS2 domain-containing protein